MVDDSEIKTKVSPFAMRTQEIKVFDGKDGYVSMNQIIQKINLGHLTEIHFKILETVNKFEFVTSRQLYYLLKLQNAEIASQDKLNNKLEQLVKCKILTRYYFTSVEGDGVFRIYCMEKMGKYLLTSRDIECKWQPSDNAKPVEMIKKKLAGNQVIVAFLRKSTHVDSYTLKPPMTDKITGKIFKPTLTIKFKYSNRKVDFIFDVIRRNETWKEDLKTRMNQYKDFYNNFVLGDSGFSNLPQLILVCEDDKHMAEVFKEIVMNNLSLDKIKIYYTTDMAQNSDKLDKSLFEFVEENGKYKIKNVEAKILG